MIVSLKSFHPLGALEAVVLNSALVAVLDACGEEGEGDAVGLVFGPDEVPYILAR